MDCLLMSNRILDKEKVFLFVLCDGVGSTVSGGEASTFCVRFMEKWFLNLQSLQRISLFFQETVIELNELLSNFLKERKTSGATTLSALLILGEYYYINHLGDSRIYTFEQGNPLILTDDQTDETGALCGYLAMNQSLPLYYKEGKHNGSSFLLCSDGFYRKAKLDILGKRIKKSNLRITLEDMALYAVNQGESDNISAIFVQYER